jgi:hypothetical protein
MDIKQLISDYHQASKSDKANIEKKITSEFSLLTENEKKEVRRIFIESRDKVVEEAKEALAELNLKNELEQISKYISMSYIAKNYFGKSRQWLNNRIKGNMVNGKPAEFTTGELNKFSSILCEISGEIKDTALRIAH